MTRFAFVIRHGHRLDHGTRSERISVARSFDPGISQIGMNQSFQVGDNLRHELRGRRLLFFSSPFRRCLETAESLLNGLQRRNIELANDTVHVEDVLREDQRPGRYSPHDFGSLHFFQDPEPLIYLQTKYNAHPLFAEHRHVKEPFPELSEHVDRRARYLLERIESFLQAPENKDVVPVLVTHLWLTKRLSTFFEGKPVQNAIYCSAAKLSLDENGKIRPEFINKRLY